MGKKITVKEQIIIESISRIEKRLNAIYKLLNANPFGRICEIRREAQELLEQNKTIKQRTSKEFIAKINQLYKKEKEQIELAEKLKDSSNIIKKQVQLEKERFDLKNELYYINKEIWKKL